MSLIYLSDEILESISGGLGNSINTYDPATGLIHQDLYLVAPPTPAWGADGDGKFLLNNKGLMAGAGVIGLSKA